MKNTEITLCGNPNSGKTTLFNRWTGANGKVGNRSGVTVAIRREALKSDRDVTVTDTPGIYSLSPFTPEEAVTLRHLEKDGPHLIVNVLDASHLSRSLFLTSQLTEKGIPMVVALNMTDEAKKRGISIDVAKLQKELGVKVFKICARSGKGLDKLTEYCLYANNVPLQKPITGATLADVAENRYRATDGIVRRVTKRNEAPKKSVSEKIDSVLLNKWLAFPVFFAVMTAVFALSAGRPANYVSGLIGSIVPLLRDGISRSPLAEYPLLCSLLSDGILPAVFGVLSFLPQLTLLFALLALLEESGYLSRIALLTDRLMSAIGLGGKSFVCLLLGFGCSVPAILSARTLKSRDEREITATVAPFIPCSAKLTLITFFTSEFFGGNALIAVSFYLCSIAATVCGALLIKFFKKGKRTDDLFVLELVDYKLPDVTAVLKEIVGQIGSFFKKIGTVIFTASVLLWFLQDFGVGFRLVSPEYSLLAHIGKCIAPLFAPLGFNDWRFAVATLSGIAAKETVIGTLSVLLGSAVGDALSPVAAYSFVLYNLLTAPCIAAISASFAEQGKKAWLSLLFQLVFAYLFTMLFYTAASLATRHGTALLAAAVTAGILLLCGLSVRTLKKHRRCGDCTRCAQDACREKKGQ